MEKWQIYHWGCVTIALQQVLRNDNDMESSVPYIFIDVHSVSHKCFFFHINVFLNEFLLIVLLGLLHVKTA